jgi:hypothetical protein
MPYKNSAKKLIYIYFLQKTWENVAPYYSLEYNLLNIYLKKTFSAPVKR